jgi:Fe2+ transport system protein B
MSEYGENLSSAFAQRRYEKITSIVDAAVRSDRAEIFALTDMLDQVFLNKYLGIPIFLTVLWTMFQFAFAVSLLFGLIAKEVVVGTYGILLGSEEANLGEALVSKGLFTPLTGFASLPLMNMLSKQTTRKMAW